LYEVERRRQRARLGAEHEHAAVVSAFEDHDLVLAADGARCRDGKEIRLGAGVGESHELDRRETSTDQAGKFFFQADVAPHHPAVVEGFDQGLAKNGIGVAVQARAVVP
jgi:hypothetical protein